MKWSALRAYKQDNHKLFRFFIVILQKPRQRTEQSVRCLGFYLKNPCKADKLYASFTVSTPLSAVLHRWTLLTSPLFSSSARHFSASLSDSNSPKTVGPLPLICASELPWRRMMLFILTRSGTSIVCSKHCPPDGKYPRNRRSPQRRACRPYSDDI